MERGFQSLLIAGKYAVDFDDNISPLENFDEPYTMSLQPMSNEKASLDCPYGPLYDILDGGFRSKKIGEYWKEDSKWRCTERAEKIKMLKNEPSNKPTILFNQLPELRSMEQANHDEHERRIKQFFSPITTTTNPQIRLTANYFSPAPMHPPPAPKKSHREQALRRRNMLSAKTRSLQKVLPWDKKMDMATIYEETYKYIKFLQAQITVLQSMPVVALNSGSENPRYVNLYGGLAKLNRQQMLETLVNSPAAQTIMYSKGCCIYSLEQLILLKDIAEKNFFISNPCIFS